MITVEFRGNNLYRNGNLLDLGAGEIMLLRDKLEITPSITDSYYTVGLEDELSVISYRVYKDLVTDPSKYWWVIADANNIENPLDITSYVGKELLIPNLLNILALLD